MNDNKPIPLTLSKRLLEALEKANPSLEKVMRDRGELRLEKRELDSRLTNALSRVRKHTAIIKASAVAVATTATALIARHLFNSDSDASKSLALTMLYLFPLGLLAWTEHHLGRWSFHFRPFRPAYAPVCPPAVHLAQDAV